MVKFILISDNFTVIFQILILITRVQQYKHQNSDISGRRLTELNPEHCVSPSPLNSISQEHDTSSSSRNDSIEDEQGESRIPFLSQGKSYVTNTTTESHSIATSLADVINAQNNQDRKNRNGRMPSAKSSNSSRTLSFDNSCGNSNGSNNSNRFQETAEGSFAILKAGRIESNDQMNDILPFKSQAIDW